MKNFLRSFIAIALAAAPLAAQEGEHAAGPPNLLKPEAGLMFWTLIIFAIFALVLWKLAYNPLTEAVRGREQSLRDALEAARRDRDEAAALLATHKSQLESSRAEAQKIIADGRAVAEKMRTQALDETKKQQDELLARAKRDIENEKTKAIEDLRREAIDIALKGASKVIEKNLDDSTNRKLVDDFLRTVGKVS